MTIVAEFALAFVVGFLFGALVLAVLSSSGDPR